MAFRTAIPAARSSRRRPSAGGLRYIATIRPSPTTTSAAATIITISAKIWPSPVPVMRENATSARLPAFSISSRQIRTTSGLRRVSTPAAPMQKISAERTRYQTMSTATPPPPRARGLASTTAPTAAISSSSDTTSNAIRNLVRNSSPICDGEPKPGCEVGALGVERLQARADDRDAQLDQQRDREQRRQHAQRRVGLGERVLEAADVGDHEHVQHHHGAGVDDHLRGGQELRLQQQEEHRQRDQVHDQRQHAVERVALEHDAERAGNREHGGEPEDDYLHRRYQLRPPATATATRHSPFSPQRRPLHGSASSISFVKIRSERS